MIVDKSNGRVIFGPLTDPNEYAYWVDWQDGAHLHVDETIAKTSEITRSDDIEFKPSKSKNGLYYFDYCVEQGETYTYSTAEQADITIKMDFEDMFLSDGEHQLKVQFNPQVSSFKNVVLEQKIDTIGSQFPFIFRNGNVKYKEFPIQGLISYQIDGIELFEDKNQVYTDYEVFRDETPARIVGGFPNAAAVTRSERVLKNKVLDWLTNGKPKLFRSPTEGNFIVRLMNVSLAPFQGTNRLVHTFSCTAVEIAEYNFENLKKFELI